MKRLRIRLLKRSAAYPGARPRRILLAAVASLVAALCVTAAAAATPMAAYCRDHRAVFRDDHAFVGINDIAFVAGDAQYRACTAGRFAASNIGYFRYPFSWATVEPRRGIFDFSPYDSLVALLAAHHVAFLPVLLGAPPWAESHQLTTNRRGFFPPTNPRQFGRFAALVVRRYGPHGVFWKLNPKLPKVPVRNWQIWNEPNLPEYWAPHPSPAAYTKLLKASYQAIKKVDPRADVITAGMPFFGPDLPAVSFYRDMLRDGAARYFDTFALHPYAVTPATVLRRALSVRALMNSHGARHKGMWITEFGWASDGPPSPYRARNPRDQANKLSRVFSLLGHDRQRLRLRGLMMWSWGDQPRAPGRIDDWGLHCGLYTLTLTPKPALRVFIRAAKRLSR